MTREPARKSILTRLELLAGLGVIAVSILVVAPNMVCAVASFLGIGLVGWLSWVVSLPPPGGRVPRELVRAAGIASLPAVVLGPLAVVIVSSLEVSHPLERMLPLPLPVSLIGTVALLCYMVAVYLRLSPVREPITTEPLADPAGRP